MLGTEPCEAAIADTAWWMSGSATFRDSTHDKHHVVDDTPYSSGPGMILKVEPVVDCVEAVQTE